VRRSFALGLALCLLVEVIAHSAVRGREAKYVGGTIAGLSENTDGEMELAEKSAEFAAKTGTKLTIPYEKIDALEYGQKAGRRLGLAVAISPLFLLSKKRRHFLTINFEDQAGKKQGAVFELAKGIVHEVLSTLEAKSGKQVEYESDEARKHAGTH